MSTQALDSRGDEIADANPRHSAYRLRRPPRWGTQIIPVSRLVDDRVFCTYLVRSIRDISPYYARAHIAMASVEISNVRPLSRVAEKSRYKRAKRLVRTMRARRMPPFEPCLLRYRGEAGYRLVMPPVVEQTERADRALVVVDGVHRLLALSRLQPRKAEVRVVLISGARLPRPAATPVNLTNVEIVNGEVSLAKKFHRLRPRLFRPAGSTLRSDRFRFDSVDGFLTACQAIA